MGSNLTLRLSTLLLATFPTTSHAQFAFEEVCTNLTALESLSDAEVETAEQSADNFIIELARLMSVEDVEAADILPDDWLKHELQVQIASCYITGNGTERDTVRAMALLESPAAAGHSSAVHVLASLRLFGSQDPALQKLGFETLQQEFESGSAYAAGKLGWAYQKGLGVEIDQSRALELYEYAAERGMTYWQYLLGHAYEMGYLGLEQDPEKASDWITRTRKVHIAIYECWVATYYADGTFPANEERQAEYQKICDKGEFVDWYTQSETD